MSNEILGTILKTNLEEADRIAQAFKRAFRDEMKDCRLEGDPKTGEIYFIPSVSFCPSKLDMTLLCVFANGWISSLELEKTILKGIKNE